MHSEECPVCRGTGKYIDVTVIDPGTSIKDKTKICHGCKGNGWIMVPDAAELKAMMENPDMAKMMGMGSDKFNHKGGNKDDRKKY